MFVSFWSSKTLCNIFNWEILLEHWIFWILTLFLLIMDKTNVMKAVRNLRNTIVLTNFTKIKGTVWKSSFWRTLLPRTFIDFFYHIQEHKSLKDIKNAFSHYYFRWNPYLTYFNRDYYSIFIQTSYFIGFSNESSIKTTNIIKIAQKIWFIEEFKFPIQNICKFVIKIPWI